MKLRIAANGQVINLPANGMPDVVLVNNSAVFNARVPAGLGHMQAFAEFSLQQ